MVINFTFYHCTYVAIYFYQFCVTYLTITYLFLFMLGVYSVSTANVLNPIYVASGCALQMHKLEKFHEM